MIVPWGFFLIKTSFLFMVRLISLFPWKMGVPSSGPCELCLLSISIDFSVFAKAKDILLLFLELFADKILSSVIMSFSGTGYISTYLPLAEWKPLPMLVLSVADRSIVLATFPVSLKLVNVFRAILRRKAFCNEFFTFPDWCDFCKFTNDKSLLLAFVFRFIWACIFAPEFSMSSRMPAGRLLLPFCSLLASISWHYLKNIKGSSMPPASKKLITSYSTRSCI